MEATSALINTQLELGVIKIDQLEDNDSQVSERLIELVSHGEYLIADKGYDSDRIREKKLMNII